jgi:hypothetical protein
MFMMIKKSMLASILFSFFMMLFAVGQAHADTQPPATQITVNKITEAEGGKKRVQIKLSNIKDGNPVTLNDLKEIHTKKVHLMIVDSTLQDYSHIHPRATSEAGVYEFEWEPKTAGHYRIWADLFPLQTNAQEYITADLTLPAKLEKPADKKSEINRTVSLKQTVDGFTFQLSFEPKILRVGQAAMGTLLITDTQGRPVRHLEPLMGAFAHIVGFEDDFKTIIHLHPMGKEPSSASDRGGPKLQFHMEPDRAGFIKFFAQVLINGKEIFVPFGVMVSE